MFLSREEKESGRPRRGVRDRPPWVHSLTGGLSPCDPILRKCLAVYSILRHVGAILDGQGDCCAILAAAADAVGGVRALRGRHAGHGAFDGDGAANFCSRLTIFISRLIRISSKFLCKDTK